MNTASRFLSAAALAALVGCVVIPDTFEATININIRHIQEQADQLLDYVEGESETIPEFTPPEDTGDTSMRIGNLHFAMNWSAPQAMAAELDDSSPRVTQIANAMKQRHPELEAIKKTGAVGENNRGFVEIVNASVFNNPAAENEAQRIIAAENEDRKALYREVARLNSDQNVPVSVVERVYAQTRLKRAKSGEIFQLPPAGEDFDTFKNSAKGRALGTSARPGAWVIIP